MKIQDLQESLLKYFNGNKNTARLMSYARILVFIYLGVTVLNVFRIPYPLSTVVNVISAISYYLFIIGAVMVFSQNKFMPIIIVYCVKFIGNLFYMIKYSFYASTFINMLIYGIIAYGLFRLYLYTSSNTSNVSMVQPPVIDDQIHNRFCEGCGNVITDEDTFCKNCGEKVK